MSRGYRDELGTVRARNDVLSEELADQEAALLEQEAELERSQAQLEELQSEVQELRLRPREETSGMPEPAPTIAASTGPWWRQKGIAWRLGLLALLILSALVKFLLTHLH